MFKMLKKVLFALLLIILILAVFLHIARKLFPLKYTEEIKASCKEFDIDTNLVSALMKAESNFNPDAVSRAGARGIMQITEDTFNFCNSSLKTEHADILNPTENIRAGVWYLSYLLKRYDGNIENALAAYNAGPVTVDRWLKDSRYSSDGKALTSIPYDETNQYIKKVMRYKAIYRLLY